ncbi:SPOR domain-containing protein [Mariniflexile litorale]|uniref:SPOR domain-containing protein n=1 Tax=Mariniflexile litorale TaxID=3045158 RepID=A0AAU7EKN4_9FLAO|nr:SPOR domain-containing protein [Mariniflexile sp. KMM 9835]MDQ8212676.1 SPOR domain-containing protein [Mariniflexile sp. KMM 9835]
MKSLNLKISALGILAFITASNYCFAQQGSVVVNQDKKIATLLEVKKEMNKNEPDADRYKIQIYNGNRSGANSAIREFNNSFSDWNSTDIYEPPNFKVWVGNFRTRLEADRALNKIKNKFPSAFIFKPINKKN